MRKALVVGIDYYEEIGSLRGCVNDATAVASILSRNADDEVNFASRLLTASAVASLVTKKQLRDSIEQLFKDDPEIALLYFAGHGYVDETGGFLCASDCRDGHDGLPLNEVMTFAQLSKATNKVIILDSCHSGVIANRPTSTKIAEIGQGMTILTASTAEQYSYEGANGAPGVFTNLLVDALSGAAANLVGDVTPGSVYAHIDQSLGPWEDQRPVFKTNVKSFVSLRKATPPIKREDLLKLPVYFPESGFKFPLDPSFEPERSPGQTTIPPDPVNTEVFKVLQRLVRVNLVRPVDAPHMWHAAMGSKSCELTVLGEHYRRLVAKERI